MNWRTLIARGMSLGIVGGLAYIQWQITTPGVITFIEWRAILWAGAISLIVTLCATWVSQGRPPIDTSPDTYTERNNRRSIRPPWS